MKINGMTLFLAVGLLAIWGGVVYLIFSHLQESTQATIPPKPENQTITEEQTYTLLLNYDDPFAIGGIKKRISQPANHKPDVPQTQHIKPRIPTNATTEINFRLLGYIASEDQKQMVVISVNGEERIAQEGDIIEGYKISLESSGSVFLLKGKERIALNKLE